MQDSDNRATAVSFLSCVFPELSYFGFFNSLIFFKFFGSNNFNTNVFIENRWGYKKFRNQTEVKPAHILFAKYIFYGRWGLKIIWL